MAEGTLDFKKLKPKLDVLISSNKDTEDMVEQNRIVRRAHVDTEQLKLQKRLDENDVMVSLRVIDQNIRAEVPPFIAFLKQSDRLAVFRDSLGAEINLEKLEVEFSRVCKYPMWEFDFFRWIDGAILHGRNFMEVVYDTTKPGHVRFEHVGTENLIFDKKAKRLEDCKRVLRKYCLTSVTLADAVKKFGFVESAVTKLRKTKETGSDNDPESYYDVYRVYVKMDGVVHTFWYSKDVDEPLTIPQPLYNGVKKQQVEIIPSADSMGIEEKVFYVPAEESFYPFVALFYYITEQEDLVEHQGRGELDYAKQDASTSIWSSFLTALGDAQHVMASPKNPVSGAAPKQTDAVINNNRIWTEPMDFFHKPYPDPIILEALKHMDRKNAEDIQQLGWQAMMNKDRKTAREVQAIEGQQNLVNSVQITLFSAALSELYVKAWRIIQSCAQQNLIPFCQISDSAGNDTQLVKGNYIIIASGEADVVKRGEKIAAMQQDWPVMQGTPVKDIFLREYLRIRYPQDYQKFWQAIDQQQAQKDNMILALGQLLTAAVIDPETKQLKPEFAQYGPQLQQLRQQIAQTMQTKQ